MSPTSTALTSKLVAAWPPERWRDVTVLVAVSGGADSVALVRALNEVRPSGDGRLVLAHFNHRLRGAASDEDQAFVEELGRELRLDVAVGAGGEEAERGREGDKARQTSEESLRAARYSFLAATADQYGARYLATAHTADDQVETVLLNMLRGTGLAGLSGIPRVRKLAAAATIVRPLLDVTRAEVLDYLRSLGQSHRDDATNRLEDYTRNRIRLQLLPLLERDYNTRVREALLRLGLIAGEADDFLDQQAEDLLDVAARSIGGGIELNAEAIAASHPALVHRALFMLWQRQLWPLQDMSQARWEQLKLMARSTGTVAPQVFPGGVRAERGGNNIRLTRQ